MQEASTELEHLILSVKLSLSVLSPREGGLPYRNDGDDRRKCRRGPSNFFTLNKRYQL